MGDSPEEMYALAVILIFLAVASVLLRLYSRSIMKAKLASDDYLIIIALIFTVATGVCMLIGAAIGDLGSHIQTTPSGMPYMAPQVERFLQISYATQLTQTLTFGFTKLAVLFLYKRIFSGNKYMKLAWIWWAMIGLIIVWTVGFFIANLLQCWPISANWDGSGSETATCIHTTRMYLGQAWSDVFTDVIILSMPIPCIWTLQMPARRKVAVSSMFLLGVLVIGAGVAKLAVFFRIANDTAKGDTDITYLLTPTIYWPMVESSLGVIGACLPVLRPVIIEHSPERFLISIRSMFSLSSIRSKQTSGDSKKTADSTSGSSSETYDLKSPKAPYKISVREISDPDIEANRPADKRTTRTAIERYDSYNNV